MSPSFICRATHDYHSHMLFNWSYRVTKQVSSSGNASYLYSGGMNVGSWPRHQVLWTFVFPRPSIWKSNYSFEIGQCHFISSSPYAIFHLAHNRELNMFPCPLLISFYHRLYGTVEFTLKRSFFSFRLPVHPLLYFFQNINNLSCSRFGFAGESGPRCIVRTEVKCPETKQVKKVANYTSKEDLYDLLVEFIHILYFRYINVEHC